MRHGVGKVRVGRVAAVAGACVAVCVGVLLVFRTPRELRHGHTLRVTGHMRAGDESRTLPGSSDLSDAKERDSNGRCFLLAFLSEVPWPPESLQVHTCAPGSSEWVHGELDSLGRATCGPFDAGATVEVRVTAFGLDYLMGPEVVLWSGSVSLPHGGGIVPCEIPIRDWPSRESTARLVVLDPDGVPVVGAFVEGAQDAPALKTTTCGLLGGESALGVMWSSGKISLRRPEERKDLQERIEVDVGGNRQFAIVTWPWRGKLDLVVHNPFFSAKRGESAVVECEHLNGSRGILILSTSDPEVRLRGLHDGPYRILCRSGDQVHGPKLVELPHSGPVVWKGEPGISEVQIHAVGDGVAVSGSRWEVVRTMAAIGGLPARVRNQYNIPVPGMDVESPSELAIECEADSAGVLRVVGMPAGTYEVFSKERGIDGRSVLSILPTETGGEPRHGVNQIRCRPPSARIVIRSSADVLGFEDVAVDIVGERSSLARTLLSSQSECRVGSLKEGLYSIRLLGRRHNKEDLDWLGGWINVYLRPGDEVTVEASLLGVKHGK